MFLCNFWLVIHRIFCHANRGVCVRDTDVVAQPLMVNEAVSSVHQFKSQRKYIQSSIVMSRCNLESQTWDDDAQYERLAQSLNVIEVPCVVLQTLALAMQCPLVILPPWPTLRCITASHLLPKTPPFPPKNSYLAVIFQLFGQMCPPLTCYLYFFGPVFVFMCMMNTLQCVWMHVFICTYCV